MSQSGRPHFNGNIFYSLWKIMLEFGVVNCVVWYRSCKMRCSNRIPSKLKHLFFFHMLILSGARSISRERVCCAVLSKANDVLAYRSQSCRIVRHVNSRRERTAGIWKTNQVHSKLVLPPRGTLFIFGDWVPAYLSSWVTADFLLISKNHAASIPFPPQPLTATV